MDSVHDKERTLLEELKKHSSLIVAYSGGVDSAYLAYAAFQALGDRMLAVTALSAAIRRATARWLKPASNEFISLTNSSRPTKFQTLIIAPTTQIAAISVKMSFLLNWTNLPLAGDLLR